MRLFYTVNETVVIQYKLLPFHMLINCDVIDAKLLFI